MDQSWGAYLLQEAKTVLVLTKSKAFVRTKSPMIIIKEGICGTPPSMSHGTHTIQNDYYALYKCNAGYVMNDESDTFLLICDALSSSWIGTPPQCIRVSCPEPPVPNHGSVLGAGRYYGDVITFVCDTKYRLYDPSYSRTCTEDGTWSGESPECFPDLSSTEVCPSGSWEYGNDTCFRAYSTTRTWTDARDECASGSPVGKLAMVADGDVQTFLEEKLEESGSTDSLWIGGSYGYVWYWDDSGNPLQYFSWAWEEPSSTSDTIQCVFLSSLPNPSGDKNHDYNWNDEDCTVNMVSDIPIYIICEYDFSCSSMIPPAISAYPKYEYDGKCIVFVKEERNWNDGRSFCSATFGIVVEIHDSVKQNFLVEKARDVDGSSGVNWWIGAKRKYSGGKSWNWVDAGPKESERCYDPGEPAHGSYSPSNPDWLYGSHVIYSCDEGDEPP
nr:CUB and sushi domain-containing protein 3-like [Lytechinus pictus]